MSSPLTKTPTKSERTRLFLESARKKIADSEQKRLEEQKAHQEDMKPLTEQFEAALKDDEDEPETVPEVHEQVDYEPKQLFTDLPLKEDVLSDSVEDDDSPPVEEQIKC